MWFVVKTPTGHEEKSKELLMGNVPLVRDVYIPLRRKVCKNKPGASTFHTQPLTSGYVFVDLRVEENAGSQGRRGKAFREAVWRQISQNVTERGYFYKKEALTGKTQQLQGCHLLSSNPKDTSPNVFIAQSHIPDEDMESFMRFNDTIGCVAEDVRIVDESFDELARVNDTVRVVTGPLAGAVGVVVSRSQAADKGKNYKDRHLEVRLGKSFCVSYPNIRRFNMVIVREAWEGERARQTRLWHEADFLVGVFQRQKGHVDDAPRALREMLSLIGKGKENPLSEVLQVIGGEIENKTDRQRLFSFANDIAANVPASGFPDALRELFPDSPIRAFLTPSEGAEAYTAIQTLQHEEFVELVVPVSLKAEFLRCVPNGQSALSPDTNAHAYNAHVAVFAEGEAGGRAIVSWGKFYDAYAKLDPKDKEGFLTDLKQKGYAKTHALLSMGCSPDAAPNSPCVSFLRMGGIGGFSLAFRGNQMEAVNTLINTVAPAAVEFWQKERLRNWRKLIRQSVLIHKREQGD